MESLTLLQELVARWKATSPKLFKVITTIALIAMFITGVPQLLQQLGLELPPVIAPLASKVIFYAGLVASVISKLTVATTDTQPTLVDINQTGSSTLNTEK